MNAAEESDTESDTEIDEQANENDENITISQAYQGISQELNYFNHILQRHRYKITDNSDASFDLLPFRRRVWYNYQ